MMRRLFIYLLLFIIGLFIGSIVTYNIMKEEELGNDIISHTVVVEKIESLGRLEVVKYNLQDIIEYKKVRQWLPNAKAALLINGEIIGCVDLTRVTGESVLITGDSILLTLPKPEICHVRIDHSKSKVYDINYGLWESADLIDTAYKYAEKELRIQANKLELDKEAKKNTRVILTSMLQSFGFSSINILFEDDINLDISRMN